MRMTIMFSKKIAKKINALVFSGSRLKPGLHEPQLPVERRVTSVSSIVVEKGYRNVTLHSTCSCGSCKPGFRLIRHRFT